MKIIDEIYDPDSKDLLSIVQANYLKEYLVELKFSDDSAKIIDFSAFLSNSHHPQIRKYLDKKLFRSFSVVDGNLNWNDYDLIFPLEDLHKGKI